MLGGSRGRAGGSRGTAAGEAPASSGAALGVSSAEGVGRGVEALDRALLVCGLALLWPMLRGNYFAAFAGSAVPSAGSPASPTLAVDILYALIVVLGLAAACLAGAIARLPRRASRAIVPLACLVGSASMAARVVVAGSLGDAPASVPAAPHASHLASLVPGPAAVAVALLVPLAFCCLALAWGCASVRGPYARRASALAPDAALSFLLSFLVTIAATRSGVGALVGALCPLASSLLWLMQARLRDGAAAAAGRADAATGCSEGAGDAVGHAEGGQARPAPARGRVAGSEDLRVLVAIAVFVVAVSVLLGVYNSPVGVFGDEGARRWAVSLGFSALLVACSAAGARRGAGVLMAFGLVAVCVLAGTFMRLMLEGTGASVGRDLLVVARRASWVVLWAAIAGTVARDSDTSAGASAGARTPGVPAGEGRGGVALFRYAAFFVTLHGVARLVVELVRGSAPWLTPSEVPAAADAMSGVVLAALLVVAVSGMVIVGMMVAMRLRDAQRAQVLAAIAASDASAARTGVPAGPAEGGEAADASPAGARGSRPGLPDDADVLAAARHAACCDLARERHLTERETDVLERLSMGHTVPRIAADLCITDNTVRTHAKAVYSKLGCHSKQQLIDIVVDRMRRR
ncbi:MAG: LuxR C-terminal-related transcriptional regulator [Coriobacteriales bacterium]|jgi:DNA-binding CsgD family transcriptional regulator